MWTDSSVQAGAPSVDALEPRTMLSAPVKAATPPPTATVPNIYAPHSTVRGQTLAKWTEDWWRWDLKYEIADSPSTDQTGDQAWRGNTGKVFFLTGVLDNEDDTPLIADVERTVQIPTGMPVFFPVANVEWSSVEFPGATDAELKAAVEASMQDTANIYATLDGVAVDDLTSYREASDLFLFDLPADHILQPWVGPGPYSDVRAYSDGYWLMLQPLKQGTHTITFGADFPAYDFKIDIKYNIEVIPQGQWNKLYPPETTPVPVSTPFAAGAPITASLLKTDSALLA